MLRIMTSNIWGDFFGNEVQVREDQLFETYIKYQPDILGLQEVTLNWHQSTLMRNMPENGYLLLNDAPAGFHNSDVLFVKADRFSVLESGMDPLFSADDRCKNIQWAALKDRQTGKIVAVCNSHFEYRNGPQYDEARASNAEQVARRMNWLRDKYDCAAFGMGDMNTTADSLAFDVYKNHGIHPLADAAPTPPSCSSHHGNPVRGEDGRFHGSVTENPFSCSIDHIIGVPGGYTVAGYVVATDQPALDATDHSPVYADLII